MDTRTWFEPRIPLAALAAALVVVAAAAAFTASLRIPAGNGDTAIPADTRSLATEIAPASPDGKISAGEAIAAFEREMGSWEGAEIMTYLVRMTSSEIATISDREVWVVKYNGVEVPFSIPDIPEGAKHSWPNGTPTAGEVLYAFVDAKTGQWLAATKGAK